MTDEPAAPGQSIARTTMSDGATTPGAPDPRLAGTGTRQEPLSPRDLFGLIPAWAALAGPVVYMVVAYAYDSFYWRLRTTPADVGLGYGEILTSVIPAIVLLFLLTIALVVVSILGAALFAARLRRQPKLFRWFWSAVAWLARHEHRHAMWAALAIVLGLIPFLYGWQGIGPDARNAAVDVICGRQAKSIRVFGFTLVHLDTPQVKAVWVSSTPSPSGFPEGKPLHELGHTVSQVVLYEDQATAGPGGAGPVSVPLNSVMLIPDSTAIKSPITSLCGSSTHTARKPWLVLGISLALLSIASEIVVVLQYLL